MTPPNETREHAASRELGWLYDQITGDEDARVCKDIPQASCRHLPRNFFAYLGANTLSKIADELSSARLILPWLLGALGAPAAFVGFLVPIREAGVLIPQLFIAALIRRVAVRKWVWVLGAALSAGALALLAAFTATGSGGSTLGWGVLVLLTVYSLARGICSVSAKDVVGKTVSKTRRGRLMGLATAFSGGTVVLLGLLLESAQGALERGDFVLILATAVGFWLASLSLFTLVREAPGATEGGGNAFAEAVKSLTLLGTDHQLRRFIIGRALLLSVALAPPFYVLLAQQSSQGPVGLGLLMTVSGVAGFVSAPLWGRLADRSSRATMALAAAAAGALGVGVFLVSLWHEALFDSMAFHAALFGAINLCHAGARLGRKTYLVDMANSDNRATYVAVSNTVIGCAMLFGGLIGFIADWLAVSTLIGLLGVLSGLSALYLLSLRNVSG